ncbi:hypothetical protein [Caulobacter endophyticus]|uniref:Uncharacterized protein n=1 Tax=Caulobacter endophyticus TaxID=2172652 RepID=A0A2T9KCF7_9CAUL|nr:hypothetical protein [Caulobacter endophyticus]PVM93652.1 hypothetical protein DDF67_02915 [Caulobacter endophyticus]
MRPEEISLQSIQVEHPDQHPDLATYRTAVFRVLPADHPNSFLVPISVNLDQYPPEEVEEQARFVFHRMMRALGDATRTWDRPGGQAASSAADARLGPAAAPAEGKPDLSA